MRAIIARYITNGYGECCDCRKLLGKYVLDCKYDQAGDVLQHLYGPLKLPVNWSAPASNVYTLKQEVYAPHGSKWSTLQMRTTGFAYVPTGCHGSPLTSCRVHLHYHGCGQGDKMPDNMIGYNQWAEANNIVVVYPLSAPALGNLLGCWDWWGATGKDFDTKQGGQLATVRTQSVSTS